MLLSIEEEATACREAFKGSKVGDIVIHCHHDNLIEVLTEPPEARILYILSDKPKHERTLRLRVFRPINMDVINSIPEFNAACAQRNAAYIEWESARAQWESACARWKSACDRWKSACDQCHAELCCPECTWNGTEIVFKEDK